MTQKGNISRDRIVEAANRLFYTQGYNPTSVSDVASEVGITKGNLHYHFRSKDDLLEAVVDLRLATISENLRQWDEAYPEARSRLKRFVQMMLKEQLEIVRYGCPMGSLNVELGKTQASLQTKARAMFDQFQEWLERTFKQMGCKNARSLSKHLMAMAQGAALMSYVYGDAKLLKQECGAIERWIDSVDPGAR